MRTRLLRARTIKKRKKPEFLRQNARSLKRVGEKWRLPRGRQSKLRRHKTSRGFLPHPGYGSPRQVKFMHPSGVQEVLVSNLSQVEGVDGSKQAIRIAAAVGSKKRNDIQKKATEMGIRILNPKNLEVRGAK